jgi:hypothetical protein
LSDEYGEHPGAELGDGIGEQVVIPQGISGADQSRREIRLGDEQGDGD